MRNWIIKVHNAKKEVLLRYTIDQKRITIGSSNSADLSLPRDDIDEINLIVETKGHKLIITPSGNNPVILNGKILNITNFVKPGDQILIGSYLLSFELSQVQDKEQQTVNIWEIMLTFSHNGETERIKTLPGYFCYDKKTRDMYWSPDIHDENRLVKVFIEKGQFVARNLFNKPDILFNGRPLKKEKISEGDTITIKGIHCIFNLTEGQARPKKKSTIQRLYETTFSYTQLKKEKRLNQILIPSLFALFLILFILGIRYINGPTPEELKEQIIKKISSSEFTQASLEQKEQLLSSCVADLSVLSKYETQYQTIIEKINYIEKQPEAELIGSVVFPKIGAMLKTFKENLSTFFNFNNHLKKFYDSFIAYRQAAESYRENQTFSNAQNLKQAANQFINDYQILNDDTEKLLEKVDSFSDDLYVLITIVNKLNDIDEMSEIVSWINSVLGSYQNVLKNIKKIRSTFESFVQNAKEIEYLIIELEKHRES